jgi:hypothetical protein
MDWNQVMEVTKGPTERDSLTNFKEMYCNIDLRLRHDAFEQPLIDLFMSFI